jgi:hypothetical protein
MSHSSRRLLAAITALPAVAFFTVGTLHAADSYWDINGATRKQRGQAVFCE